MIDFLTAATTTAIAYQVGQGWSALYRGWRHQGRTIRRGHRWIVRHSR